MKLLKKDYYEKLFGKKEKTVEDYQFIVTHAQEKIMELQNKCSHANHETVMYSWRPGAFQPSRICSDCKTLLPGITEEESAQTWKDWNAKFFR